jgi:hypothetical protein
MCPVYVMIAGYLSEPAAAFLPLDPNPPADAGAPSALVRQVAAYASAGQGR